MAMEIDNLDLDFDFTSLDPLVDILLDGMLPAHGQLKSAPKQWVKSIFKEMSRGILKFAELLTSASVRDRVERQLKASQIEKINTYTENTFVFATELIELSERAKALYGMSRDGLITSAHLNRRAAAVDVQPMLTRCVALIREHNEISELLFTGASPTVFGVLWENKLSLVLCAVGITLMFIPGAQFGIPIAVEQTLAAVGGLCALGGIGAAYFRKKNFNADQFLSQLQASLSTVRNDMEEVQRLLARIDETQEAAELASEKLKLKTISENLIGLFTELSSEGIKIQQLATAFPKLRKQETCIIS